jgi:nicotinate dehydrogenase subunit B
MPEREIPGFETERYELHSGPTWKFATDRRDFFKMLGGGLVVILAVTSKAGAQESGRGGGRPAMPQDIGAWLHISESGAITVYTGKVEMGQNIRTSLTQAVAEELRTSPSSIQLVMGDTMLTPYDFGTVGSMTTPIMAPQLHKAAAVAREMLLDIAAARSAIARHASPSHSANSPKAGSLRRQLRPTLMSHPQASGRSPVTICRSSMPARSSRAARNSPPT